MEHLQDFHCKALIHSNLECQKKENFLKRKIINMKTLPYKKTFFPLLAGGCDPQFSARHAGDWVMDTPGGLTRGR
jgi:hypothetical protein